MWTCDQKCEHFTFALALRANKNENGGAIHFLLLCAPEYKVAYVNKFPRDSNLKVEKINNKAWKSLQAIYIFVQLFGSVQNTFFVFRISSRTFSESVSRTSSKT
jgi:hypothetical protein